MFEIIFLYIVINTTSAALALSLLPRKIAHKIFDLHEDKPSWKYIVMFYIVGLGCVNLFIVLIFWLCKISKRIYIDWIKADE